MKKGVVLIFIISQLSFASYTNWLQHREKIRKDPSVIGYYTFEDFEGMKLKNLAGEHHTFVTEDITIVPGRFPEKSAVRIEAGGYISNPGNPEESFDIKNKQFTFEMWLVKIPGRDSEAGMMIFNCGRAYNSSWMVHTTFPDGPIAFILGNPERKNLYFYTSKVKDRVWNHIVITWDGKEIKTYVNGKLSSTSKYEGTYYPDPNRTPSWLGRQAFWLGERDNKIGAVLVIDELVIYNRALSEKEVEEHFLAGGGDEVINVEPVTVPEISITFPKDTNGYFPLGTKITVVFSIKNKEDRYLVDYRILDKDNNVVYKSNELVISPEGEKKSIEIDTPDKCGIYWLEVTARAEKTKKLVSRQEFPFGITVKLPSLKDVSEESPLGLQYASFWKVRDGLFYGMKWDRAFYHEFLWSYIEKTPGVYNWEGADKRVDELLSGGNAILFIIHGVPDWAAIKPSPYGNIHASYGPRDVEVMKKFIRALVNRYKDRVKYWEVWNEPGCNVFAPDDTVPPKGYATPERAEEYVRILKATYEAIKEVDPEAKVVGINGCPVFLVWTPEVLKAGGGDYLDIIGFHNYIRDNPNNFLSGEQNPIKKMKKIIKDYTGRDIPLWDSETAFHLPYRVNGRPMTEEYFLENYKDKMVGGEEYYIEACLTLVPERRSACWEIQATLLSFAEGVEKRFLHTSRGLLLDYPVNEKGVAFAALAKVITEKKEVKEIETGTTQVRGVLITDKKGNRTCVVWSVNKFPAVVSLVLDGNKEYTGMDFLGNPFKIPKTNSEGLLTLQVFQEPTYIFDVPEEVRGVKVMEITGENISNLDSPYHGEVVISNYLKKTMSALVSPELPDGWSVDINKKIEIPEGGTAKVPFTIRSVKGKEGTLPIKFNLLSESNEILATSQKNVLMRKIWNIPKSPAIIVLNGDTEKWKRLKRVELKAEKEENVVIGKKDPFLPVEHPHWEGPQDLSFSVSSVWRDDEIYLLIEVIDNDPVSAPDTKNLYLYDCVEIFVDITDIKEDIGTKKTKVPGIVQIMVAPALKDEVSTCRTVVLGEGAFPKFVGRKTEKGYLVEGRIQLVPGSGLKIRKGQIIGLNVAVDDASNLEDKRKVQMMLFGTASAWANPLEWGRFYLEE